MKLFFGEYEPANRELSIGNARVAFLNGVRLHVPQVLEELNGQPFELYRNIGAPFVQWWEVKYRRVGNGTGLRGSLIRWSNTWRLIPEWCLEYALRTMWEWHNFPPQREKLIWQQGGGSWMVPTHDEERKFVFEHPGWEPTYNYRQQIKAEIARAFNERLDEYLSRLQKVLSQLNHFVSQKFPESTPAFFSRSCRLISRM